jgi:hypothetical protein
LHLNFLEFNAQVNARNLPQQLITLESKNNKVAQKGKTRQTTFSKQPLTRLPLQNNKPNRLHATESKTSISCIL